MCRVVSRRTSHRRWRSSSPDETVGAMQRVLLGLVLARA
jgi:hypothetical protein